MKTDLQKAIDVLEKAGFHVDRAYEEDNRDAGNSFAKTGAICLRITPVKLDTAAEIERLKSQPIKADREGSL